MMEQPTNIEVLNSILLAIKIELQLLIDEGKLYAKTNQTEYSSILNYQIEGLWKAEKIIVEKIKSIS